MESVKERQYRKKILDLYNDPFEGFSSANVLYEKLNKEIPLKFIKQVLSETKTEQITSNFNPNAKKYIPITAPPYTYQMDLTFFESMNLYKNNNDGVYILLNIIEISSRKAWSYGLKNKTKDAVFDAVSDFISKNTVKRLESDAGSEFDNNQLKEMCIQSEIELFLFDKKESPNSMGKIERFNKTIRDKITKYMTAKETNRFIDVLPKLIDNYNNTKHRSINMTPNEAYSQENMSEIEFHEKQKGYKVKDEILTKYKIGEKVRYKLERTGENKFTKSNVGWSKTVHYIKGVNRNGTNVLLDNNTWYFIYQIKKVDDESKSVFTTGEQIKAIKEKKQTRKLQKEGLL